MTIKYEQFPFYKNRSYKMKNNTLYRSSFLIILPIGALFYIFSQSLTNDQKFDFQLSSAIECKAATVQNLIPTDDKHRGAHVFGQIDTTNFQSFIQNNIEWVTLVAWGSQEDHQSPIVRHHNGDSLHIQQNDSSWLKRIELVREAGFKVFLKPHIWIHSRADGKWRSDIFPSKEENWESWKESYRDFILRYARIAEQAKAEMFCVGTELSRLSIEKPAFWKHLIQEVRTIYSGKITYAANWYNEFEKVSFWDELDFIGIQAYFPLAENKYPSVEQISKGWDKHFPSMESTSKKYDRKILFTEMGYKSTANSAAKPWEWIEDSSDLDNPFSGETQTNCYQAFFNTVWKKEWFAGVHIWQFRSDHVNDHEKNNLDFTPQGKPAENIIAKGFK